MNISRDVKFCRWYVVCDAYIPPPAPPPLFFQTRMLPSRPPLTTIDSSAVAAAKGGLEVQVDHGVVVVGLMEVVPGM